MAKAAADLKELPPPRRSETFHTTDVVHDIRQAGGAGRPSKGLKALTLKLAPRNRMRLVALLDELVTSDAFETRDDAIGHILDVYESGGGKAKPSAPAVPPATERDSSKGFTRGEVVYWRPDHWQTIAVQSRKRRETPSQLVATLISRGMTYSLIAGNADTRKPLLDLEKQLGKPKRK